MLPSVAFTHQGPMLRRARQILPALVLALAALLCCARPAEAQAKGGDVTLVNSWRSILGPVEVHLVFTDTNDKQQDYSLAQAPPDFVKMLPLALQNESKFPLLNPKVRYFDGLWLANGTKVCNEVIAGTKQTYPAGGNNEAYDISCRPFKVGIISANILPNVSSYIPKYNSQGALVVPAGTPANETPGYNAPHVMQLQLDFEVPAANLLRYTLTTPCTCHDQHNVLGVVTCNKDPDFSSLFDVTIQTKINSTALDSMQFGPRPQMQTGYLVMQTALVLKDGKAVEQKIASLESTLEQQLAELAVSVAATQEFSFAQVIYDFLKDLFTYGIGGLYEMSCNGQLFHNIAMDPSGGATYKAPTVNQMAKTVDQAFKTLFLALGTGSRVGFTKIDVVEGPGKALVFKLTYPTPAKPVLTNTVAASNKGIHLQGATISTAVQEIKAGVPVMVRGTNFMETAINGLSIGWTKTVAGIQKDTMEWGPKGGKMQSVDVNPLVGFKPTGLKPGTDYQFRLHQCDPISCAPWSDWLTTNTQGSGSNDVTIWMDNNFAQPVGTGTALPNGTFMIKTVIPANTASGTHTLHAAMGGASAKQKAETPQASIQISVCAAGGCGPTISVLNSGRPMQPPVNLMYPSTVPIRGAGFAPGAVVTLYLDKANGPKLGTATTGKLGAFQGSFQIPMSAGGGHTIVAIQQSGGKTLQATEQVVLMAQPK